jgi:murein L,D-transpeptidase YafK
MLRSKFVTAVLLGGVVAAVAALGGCGQFSPPYMKPLSARTAMLLGTKGMTEQQPILIRIFKAESELEIWKQKDDGHYYHLKTYPICAYSGGLGPKLKQGDRQAPEGFYLVDKDLMNPKSKYYLAFNMGYPNAYDRSFGRTGANLMVHGDCTSSGCYAMTDAVMEEIYVLAREAFAGGQEKFQLHAFPFRMTKANLAAQKEHDWYTFWKNLKEGYDFFETTRLAPALAVCGKRYVVNATFADGKHPHPRRSCPRYEKLPVVAFKPPKEAPNMSHASLSKPLGSVMGLSFGSITPTYRAMTLGPATPTLSKKSKKKTLSKKSKKKK